LVLKAETSTRRHSQQARDSLLSVGAHILGAIVNDVSQKRGHYGYYSDYGYYRGYGYHSYYGYYGDREKKAV
jgi:Mrp family chromosome partitioning ATPase